MLHQVNKVYQSCFLAPEQFLRDHTLAVAIGVELYRAGRNNAYEIRAETFKKRAPPFNAVYG
jgi:hypothetical protein